MRRSTFTFIAPGVLLVSLLAVASCSKSSTSQATDTQTSETPVAVSKIELGRNVDIDKRVTDQTRQFAPNETIFASVVTNGASSSTELRARWTFEDGQLVDESTQTIAPAGNAATEFHVAKPDGWPVGKYKVEIFLNGAPAGSEEFEVRRTS